MVGYRLSFGAFGGVRLLHDASLVDDGAILGVSVVMLTVGMIVQAIVVVLVGSDVVVMNVGKTVRVAFDDYEAIVT